ncbi:MAG: hypothetical protein RQ826_16345, partial [Xanthomonadales bacterium]|nr:hypothetical protein [Xanthomonadales bacterium]
AGEGCRSYSENLEMEVEERIKELRDAQREALIQKEIAEGIIAAVREVGVEVPVVVRLEGTNVDKGKQLLDDSGLAIISADDLNDAARKVVAAASE